METKDIILAVSYTHLGQKRRVALAGILAMEPEYLILDEPVAGMDAPGKKILFCLLYTSW